MGREWKYCVVGNIKRTRVGAEGALRYGTPAFRGGTRVYLCGKDLQYIYDTIEVIGLNRHKRFQATAVPRNLIENVRLRKTYKPSVLDIMDDYECGDNWWGNTEEDRLSAMEFVENWKRENPGDP